MSIDNVGLLSSQWGGGFLLHLLKVTRTRFDNLWLAILTRNILRVTPLCLLFLIPRGDPNASLLPTEILGPKEEAGTPENENIELVSLVSSVDESYAKISQEHRILTLGGLKQESASEQRSV
ncbi:Folate-biopterin transporter [Populus alba x Populus x berolinensis]|uniref:Folate-biopterin transporter n=1 Tax=Populus alba x Populus x berolinensis TaxID=444605 RepID=A0AAD6L9W4_9ROSI|nr:Folate-biopterin transporter [Populus alba x Populus x berolinensis]